MDLQDREIKLVHPAKRFQGQFIDGFIAYLLGAIAFYLLHTVIDKDISILVAIAIGVTYFLFSDALPNGQGVGEKLLKIRVINQETLLPFSLAESFLRNITFPFGIIDWVFIFFGSHRRLGDFIASTIVVKM